MSIIHLGCKRVCCECQTTMGYKPGEDGTVTHGYCSGCVVAPYFKELAAHVVTCDTCVCSFLHIEGFIIRCDRGKELKEKYLKAIEAAKKIEA
jgi:hypothetical protein